MIQKPLRLQTSFVICIRVTLHRIEKNYRNLKNTESSKMSEILKLP